MDLSPISSKHQHPGKTCSKMLPYISTKPNIRLIFPGLKGLFRDFGFDLTLRGLLCEDTSGNVGSEPVLPLEFGLSGSFSEPSVSIIWVAALGPEGNSKRNSNCPGISQPG